MPSLYVGLVFGCFCSSASLEYVGKRFRASDVDIWKIVLIVIGERDPQGLTGARKAIFRWEGDKPAWRKAVTQPFRWMDLEVVKEQLKQCVVSAAKRQSKMPER